MTRTELMERYNSTHDECCICGCDLTANGGVLGDYFEMDKEGDFYCSECAARFEDGDERLFDPSLEEFDDEDAKELSDRQREFFIKIKHELRHLADYIYPDGDIHANCCLERLECMINEFEDTFKDKNTYVQLIDRETGEVSRKHFFKGDVDALCHYTSRLYAFNDIDETYTVDKVVCDGVTLRYVGWQPGMVFRFVDESGNIVFSNSYEQWDH